MASSMSVSGVNEHNFRMEYLVRYANKSDGDLGGELGGFPEKLCHQFMCS